VAAGPGRARRIDARMALIMMTVVIDLIGFGIVLPILPLWAKHFGAGAAVIGILSASYSLMQVIFAPLWGRLSDRIGRRPVILITLVGSCLSALLIGVAHTIVLLFVGRIINGISGASYATAQAYVADITSEEDRARGMGLIGAAFGIGFIIGPALGALLSLISESAPFFFAAGLAAVNVVLAYRLLPESRRPGAVAISMGRMAMIRMSLTSPRLAPLVWVTFLSTFAFVGMEATFALLGSDRFGYGPGTMGVLFAFVGVAAAVGQGFLVGRAVTRFGETHVMVAGLAGTAIGLGLLAVAFNLIVVLLALAILGIFSGLAFATISALISQAAPVDLQGGVLGLAASANGLARVGGPILAGVLFEYVNPSTPLVVGAVVTAVCVLIATRTVLRPAAV
jgi:DHA1 family tetracycline resistance protein-like MFS transporter